ncbi:MAG: hypothetical protein IPI59_15800 [Sphingobacteriales bacterium]|jgi:hypothetical protein|nr:hypothetical protein [Sphingobacteriales bacterium]MBP9141946.1 hypothetical protein [Chitinophagales bacterium]MDA0199129.1 hypothetical protein [Bacteroidota bacterium]MBK6888534.1 hypothetical protein [Sphingobacteriales bacterium]MBK7528959.1 hypothetical protein [Sphingobacteriales bacterium]
MKHLRLIPLMLLAVVALFSCDNPGKNKEAEAKQMATIDSLAKVEVEKVKKGILANCDQTIMAAAAAKADSIMAAAAGKKGAAATPTPPKNTGKKEPAKPAQKPAEQPKKDEIKGRTGKVEENKSTSGTANAPSKVATKPSDIKGRTGAQPSNK